MARIKITVDIEETDTDDSFGGKSGIAVKAPWPPQNTGDALIFLNNLDCAFRALKRLFYYKLTYSGVLPDEGNPDYLSTSISARDYAEGQEILTQTKKEE